ncbi:acyl-CoA dehydrogenase family protein [Pusillimonas sp. SM2304]|uniref:acyl-CoA dehydrogenase family protein n=1 Tax=Pusillimonas sp. SM2304 TaxID=3073241 RepID=UPI0028760348|nr:acyl-CoA dehydrogenase family protein [Pusillimonas sp. SM2304]MDS1139059.1 acyl-CoA dehydrogenase family protein [Pusillimonas sp. SM2304]
MKATHYDEVYDSYRGQIRRFALEKVAPFAATVDEDERPPLEAYEASLALGLPGLPFSEEFGGQDGDVISQIITVEELARVCASSATTVSTCWIMMLVQRFGSDEQKRKLIPPVVQGQQRSAWGLTEPKGGSDLMGVVASAKKTADGWLLNGTKRFITNGGWADWYLIFARTEPEKFGIFLVSKQDQGVSFGTPERKMGLRGSPTCDVILEDCLIPLDRVVGDPAKGGEYIRAGLLASRLKYAAHGLGIAQGALDEAVAYTQGREQFGRPVSDFQMIKGMVADMAMKVEAGRALLMHAATLVLNQEPGAKKYASMAKVTCTDAAMSVATDAVQLHGGYGYLKDYPVERMLRDAKITQIWEGTNQIQRLMIAKEVYAG